MSYYYRSYLGVLKTNFMLVIIAFVLLFPTFFIWAGIPLYIVGDAFTSKYSIYLGISLSGGVLFSLYFLPINLKVARYIAVERNSSILYSFLRIEVGWVFAIALIWLLCLVFLFH